MSKVVKILAATAIGFAAGVLLAPKSGKETRNDLKKKAVQAKQEVEKTAQRVENAVKEAKSHMHSASKKASTDKRER